MAGRRRRPEGTQATAAAKPRKGPRRSVPPHGRPVRSSRYDDRSVGPRLRASLRTRGESVISAHGREPVQAGGDSSDCSGEAAKGSPEVCAGSRTPRSTREPQDEGERVSSAHGREAAQAGGDSSDCSGEAAKGSPEVCAGSRTPRSKLKLRRQVLRPALTREPQDEGISSLACRGYRRGCHAADTESKCPPHRTPASRSPSDPTAPGSSSQTQPKFASQCSPNCRPATR